MNKLIILNGILLFLILIVLSSCKSKNSWTCQGDCDNGKGTKIWTDGGIDKGYWHNGKLDGYGFQFFGKTSDFAGDTFSGELKNGKFNGQGTYYDKSEDATHTGEFKNGLPNGKGAVHWGKNSVTPNGYCEGNFKDGRMDGMGIKFWGTSGKWMNDKYIGEWKNGEMDGKGRYYVGDEGYFEGTWKNGEQNGDGIFVFKDGEVFKGHWVNGECPELAERVRLKK